MTNKCKCKCRKDDVVVLMTKAKEPGAGYFEKFLDTLEPPLRADYTWHVFYIKSMLDSQEGLKSKLQQLCKKKGKKPIVVSALFDADSEMPIAPLQQYIRTFYSSSSADEITIAFRDRVLLNIPGSEIPRSNGFYNNGGGGYTNIFVADWFPKGYNNTSFFTSLARSGYPIETSSEPDDIGSGSILGDTSGFTSPDFYEKAQTFDNLDQAPTLSDASLAQATISLGNNSNIKEIDGQNYLALNSPEGTRYLGIYGNPIYSAEDNLKVVTGMAGMVLCDSQIYDGSTCVKLDKSIAAGRAVNATSGFGVAFPDI